MCTGTFISCFDELKNPCLWHFPLLDEVRCGFFVGLVTWQALLALSAPVENGTGDTDFTH